MFDLYLESRIVSATLTLVMTFAGSNPTRRWPPIRTGVRVPASTARRCDKPRGAPQFAIAGLPAAERPRVDAGHASSIIIPSPAETWPQTISAAKQRPQAREPSARENGPPQSNPAPVETTHYCARFVRCLPSAERCLRCCRACRPALPKPVSRKLMNPWASL